MTDFSHKFIKLISPLTLRLLMINIITIIVLIGGVFFLGIYKGELIQTERHDLETDTRTMGLFIESTMIKQDKQTLSYRLNKPLINKMFAQLSHRLNTHIYIFDKNKDKITDNWSDFLKNHQSEIRHEDIFFIAQDELSAPLEQAFNTNQNTHSSWQEGGEHTLVLNSTVLIKDPAGDTLGAISISRGNIFKNTVDRARIRFLMICGVSILVTTLLSIYLSQTITKPISKLAHAAHTIRKQCKQTLEDPTLDKRKDEIGALYHSLKEMTQALFNRMGEIESFAADVSHEIKNPLASIQSAIDTLPKVKSDAHKKQLMEIIASDVARLDRLISDISNASRVDAEMSRIDFEKIDLKELLEAIINIYNNTIQQDAAPIEFYNMTKGNHFINGIESRISQVVQNLLGNALSFSDEKDPIKIFLDADKADLKVSVENLGSSIPEKQLTKVFERFYSDRPQNKAQHHVDLNHSGLGLSISKQIIEAHHGKIWAENIKDSKGEIIGVRFTFTLRPLNNA